MKKKAKRQIRKAVKQHSEKRELQEAERIIDDSYRELGEPPRCLECNRKFTRISPTQNYCNGPEATCAYTALKRREARKMLAQEEDL